MSLWPRTTGRFTKKTSSACSRARALARAERRRIRLLWCIGYGFGFIPSVQGLARAVERGGLKLPGQVRRKPWQTALPGLPGAHTRELSCARLQSEPHYLP